jgi:hypothetical protein
MKTKTLLTYGAIAAGAYLAYRYFMKPKDANFSNASGGGLLIPTSGTAQSSGSLILNQFNAWVDAYVKLKKYPSYIWKPCKDMVLKAYTKNASNGQLMSNMAMRQMFEICVNQKLLNMQNQANLGSSSVRNTATM